MIHRIYSNLPSFKELVFHDGLNILLSDKTPQSTQRQTRNGAGKTSLIELVSFLLGADATKDKSVFKAEELEHFTFGMELTLQNYHIRIERMAARPGRIIIYGEVEGWPIQPKQKSSQGENVFSNDEWRSILGYLLFGLAVDADESNGAPSFRSLVSYFIRRQMSEAFSSPFLHAKMQQTWDKQLSLMYLLGLDWRLAREWQQLRDKKISIEALKKARKDISLSPIIVRDTKSLRTQQIVLENTLKELKSNIEAFSVLEQYEVFEKEANDARRQMVDLQNDDTLDRALVRDLQGAVTSETPPGLEELEAVYREAKVILPNTVIRRIEEVRIFHESVVRNRQSYLNEQIQDAQRRIERRIAEMQALNERLGELLDLLNTYGALNTLGEMQAEYARRSAELETIRAEYNRANQFEQSSVELRREQDALYLRLSRNFEEQKDVLISAILYFENISRRLYEEAGSLIIDSTSNGPNFEVQMPAKRSKGISNMQIFCFDIMLMHLLQERQLGTGFLIHDSHLFDGVDERQVAQALQVGSELAQELNFQYIVTLNSDALPKFYDSGFSIDQYILPVRLTDATEDGGLFGMRFN